jgi:hypothetical protein
MAIQEGPQGGRGPDDEVVVDVYLAFNEHWAHIRKARVHVVEAGRAVDEAKAGGGSGGGGGVGLSRSRGRRPPACAAPWKTV